MEALILHFVIRKQAYSGISTIPSELCQILNLKNKDELIVELLKIKREGKIIVIDEKMKKEIKEKMYKVEFEK